MEPLTVFRFVSWILLIFGYHEVFAASLLQYNEPPNHLIIPGALQNLSETKSFNTSPDFSFRFESYYSLTPLPVASILMNAVNALATLAHQEFSMKITEVQDMVLPAYRDVRMELTVNRPYRVFDNRAAIWGIYSAINEMVSQRVFNGSRFALFWEDKNVATFSIWKPESVRLSLDSSIDGGNTTALDRLLAGNLQPGFAYIPNGAKLLFQEVVMTVLATLKVLAHWPDDVSIYPFTCKAAGFDTVLQMDFGGPPRREPPYLLTTYVTDVVRQIPRYMLAKKRFEDLAALIVFQGVFIGQASIFGPRIDMINDQ